MPEEPAQNLVSSFRAREQVKHAFDAIIGWIEDCDRVLRDRAKANLSDQNSHEYLMARFEETVEMFERDDVLFERAKQGDDSAVDQLQRRLKLFSAQVNLIERHLATIKETKG